MSDPTHASDSPVPRLVSDGEAAARELVGTPSTEDDRELFGIRDLAEEFGITPRTIRFYETKGLLAPVRVGSSRVYSRRDRARLALILRAKAIGSSLADIQQYLELYGQHGEGREAQLAFVIRRTQEAIDELEQRKAHIEATVEQLRMYQESAQVTLDARRGGES